MDYSKTNKAKRSYRRDITIISNMSANHLIKNGKLSEITTRDIEAYKEQRLRDVTKGTVNRELNTIKAAFTKAGEWGYLSQNPAAAVRRFKEAKSPPRYFTSDEIERIFGVISNNDNRFKSAIYLLLMTGMRRDELVNLEWKDINLKNNVLHVQPKPDWNPKDYEFRTIPFNGDVKEILLGLARNNGDGIVFSGESGKFYCTPESLSRIFRRILKKAGIKGACLHTLRHTYASHLVMSGVDIPTVQKLLGHSQITTTMRYAHLAPDHLRSAVEKLSFSCCPFAAHEREKEVENGQILKFQKR